MIRILVVDDEKPARAELRAILEGRPDVRVVGEAGSARAAVEAARRERPDVVLLDIQMPGRSGLEAAGELQRAGAAIVFVTAYDDYAVEAFEREAADYVLKPVRPERLIRAIRRAAAARTDLARLERLLERLGRGAPRIVGLKGGRDTRHVLDPADIDFFRAEGEGCSCRTRGETYEVRQTLAELEARLGDRGFMRVHRSYLANLDRVTEVVPWFAGSVKLRFGASEEPEVTVGRRHAADVKRRLGWK